ncbi:MAG: DNA starvation/stationary phase protection protein [Legionellales bacterium]|nr:DNA starvation/stationary phase protection protein [Legionellales bacterium]
MTKLIECLKTVLADTYVVYLKTQDYHWNVTGPNFYSYHKMFEEQYRELAEAVDEIAERIRAVGERAPSGFKVYDEYTKVNEVTVTTDSVSMVKDLHSSHLTVIQSLQKLKEEAVTQGDSVTEDLAIGRLTIHQKVAWMLSATAG